MTVSARTTCRAVGAVLLLGFAAALSACAALDELSGVPDEAGDEDALRKRDSGARAGDSGAALDASAQGTLRVAAGETSPYTDPAGNLWSADTGYAGGTAYTTPSPVPIAGTNSPRLYNSERYGDDATSFSYSFALAPGAYVLKLGFAEIYVNGPGKRVFDVVVGGQTVLSNFDIYAAAGGMNTAVERQFPVTVGASGQLQIEFRPGSVQNPKVNTIAIVPAVDGGSGGMPDAAAADSGGTSDAGSPVSCAGQTCSGHGTCNQANGSAYCVCDSGYYPSGLSCEQGTPAVTIDYTRAIRSIDDKTYGFDCPDCMDPKFTTNPAFVSMLKTVGGGAALIRLHGWGMVTQGSNECWLNADGSWNATKIHDALAPLVQAGLPLLINIPSGPGGDGDDNADAIASMAGNLVKIVNVDNHFGVKYVEAPNEQEGKISAAQMATLLSKASSAAKASDPTVLVGGPALSWCDSGYIQSVVQGAGGSVDFVSCHTYAGDGTQSNTTSFDSARSVAGSMQQIRSSLDAISPNRHIPILLDEYNIGWSYTPAIYDSRGAVYDTIVQGAVLAGGGDVSNIWDVSPGHDMSIVDQNLVLHDPAHLFAVLNTYGHGQLVSTTAADPSSIYAYATQDTSAPARTIVLVNMTTSSKTLTVATIGWAPTTVAQYQVTAAGYAGPSSLSWSSIASGGVAVGPESVVMLVSRDP